ncbi:MULTISPECIES: GNAT family N-acetyltransferase [unclassified Pseudomonas]|uniref:GNAT family N-acetyltransferase n=1 Tax=unclassified Pseudomonas TaxID=196821 RepID=UPI0015A10139|nr:MULTISPECIES: GNAT family N-acetyltransferase [unclassified Pseudomonas]NWC90933.1 GNAT family N-acetyltransferase [Pseudomonas sp. IPO3779]NWD17063.1 GNAT family N-acetyltransferase [Pseudomonas sp. IPO3778]
MHSTVASDATTQYHQTEAHFLAAVCPLHRRYSSSVNAYFSAVDPAPWNLLSIRVGSGALDEAMLEAQDLIRRTPLGVHVVIHDDEVEGLWQALTDSGLVAFEKTTAMCLDLSTFTPLPADRQARVNLTQHLSDWAGPVGNAFGLPEGGIANYQAQHQRALDSDQGFYHFTLSVNTVVVCSLTLSMCEGVARLNDIGTEIAARGKGYATQLIHAALAYARALGARQCFLEATPAGVSLYRKLGFVRLFGYQAFFRGPVVPVSVEGDFCGLRVLQFQQILLGFKPAGEPGQTA